MKAKTSDNNPYGWDVFVYDDKNNPIFFLGKDYTRKSDADELTNEFNSAISAYVAQETAPLLAEISALKAEVEEKGILDTIYVMSEMFTIYVRSDEYITLSKEDRNKVVDVYVNAKCVLNNTLRQLQRRQRELYDNRP